jgi:beta-xylosidase
MKLHFNDLSLAEPDPYIFKYQETYFLYCSNAKGVLVFSSSDKLNWKREPNAFSRFGYCDYWGPCVYEDQGVFYLYCSTRKEEDPDPNHESLIVAEASTPYGPFVYLRSICPPFSIDPHVVKSGDSLYLFYSFNRLKGDKVGTVVAVDKMLSPLYLSGEPKIVLEPSFSQEIFEKNRYAEGQDWYTLEGAFYFRSGDWHYLMYSGGCYEKETYFVGYATCHSAEDDLTKLHFVKHTVGDGFCPLIYKNKDEEGAGHNSVLFDHGDIDVFYHARDYGQAQQPRTARMLLLQAQEGQLSIKSR